MRVKLPLVAREVRESPKDHRCLPFPAYGPYPIKQYPIEAYQDRDKALVRAGTDAVMLIIEKMGRKQTYTLTGIPRAYFHKSTWTSSGMDDLIAILGDMVRHTDRTVQAYARDQMNRLVDNAATLQKGADSGKSK